MSAFEEEAPTGMLLQQAPTDWRAITARSKTRLRVSTEINAALSLCHLVPLT